MDNRANYVHQIERRYPELQIETATLIQEGQYNDVLVMNEGIIFRFAKVPAAIESLRQEMVLLQSLQEQVSLSIPNPIYHSVEPGILGQVYAGYRMIPGKPLWRDAFQAISDPQARKRMSHQLSGFLYELHNVPADSLAIRLPVADGREKWASMYERIRALLFGAMRPDARRQVAAHFESYLDRPEMHEFEPVLRHGDFGTGNTLYDPDKLEIVGIIDFGGAGLGDAAVDFAALRACYGQAFYESCCAVYPEMEQAIARVDFYRSTFALQEALFGAENGDEVAFRNGMAEYI